MQHITGIPRNQMTFGSLEDSIATDNPIQFIKKLSCLVRLNIILQHYRKAMFYMSTSIKKHYLWSLAQKNCITIVNSDWLSYFIT